jgi:carboxylesterase
MTAVDHSIVYPGNRTGFLLIHGLGGTPAEMRFVARGIAQAGYTVHCPQLAGHCGSYEDLRLTTWTEWYAGVLTAYENLKAECDTVIVGGLSAGAILALRLAADHPNDIHGTVLMAPTLKLDGWGVPWYSVLFHLVRDKFSADFFPFAERDPYGIKDPRVRALVTQAIQSGDSAQAGQMTNPGRVMLELRRLISNVKPRLGQIKQPTLILHPREDDRASFRSNAVQLQLKLGGLVDTVVLDDSYHVVTFDRQRDLVVTRTLAYASWLESQQKSVASRNVARKAASIGKSAPMSKSASASSAA